MSDRDAITSRTSTPMIVCEAMYLQGIRQVKTNHGCSVLRTCHAALICWGLGAAVTCCSVDQLHIALTSYCQACEARNLLYPEGMLAKSPRGTVASPDSDLYQLVKAKGVQFVLDTIKHVSLDTEMHRCSASLLLIIVQSLVYCSQQLTFTRAEFELEAMQSRTLDEPGEWPKNTLKQMLMMDGVNALLALVYKNNVADIQATAMSCITCLVRLSKYAAEQLICPVQMFVIVNRDDVKQWQLKRRSKEKRTAPLGCNIPTGVAVMLAAMKLHRNKYTVSAAVVHGVSALLDQGSGSVIRALETTQAFSGPRNFHIPQIRLFSISPIRSTPSKRRWEVLELCVGFLRRWNRFVEHAATTPAPQLTTVLTADTVHEQVLRLVLRLITDSKSAAMYIESQQDSVATLNAALAVHAGKLELQQYAAEAIALMESYQQAYSVPDSLRRPSTATTAWRSPPMPDVLYPTPIRSRPTTPATFPSQSSSSAAGRPASIERLMQTDFAALERMEHAASPNRSRPYSAKPPSRQELHLQRVRDVYQHGGPQRRRRPQKPDSSSGSSRQYSRTMPTAFTSVGMDKTNSATSSTKQEQASRQQPTLRRSQTLPRLSEDWTNTMSPAASSTNSPDQSFECIEDLQSLQRILGGIGQVRC